MITMMIPLAVFCDYFCYAGVFFAIKLDSEIEQVE